MNDDKFENVVIFDRHPDATFVFLSINWAKGHQPKKNTHSYLSPASWLNSFLLVRQAMHLGIETQFVEHPSRQKSTSKKKVWLM